MNRTYLEDTVFHDLWFNPVLALRSGQSLIHMSAHSAGISQQDLIGDRTGDFGYDPRNPLRFMTEVFCDHCVSDWNPVLSPERQTLDDPPLGAVRVCSTMFELICCLSLAINIKLNITVFLIALQVITFDLTYYSLFL